MRRSKVVAMDPARVGVPAGEPQMMFQPIVDLTRSAAVVGYEALARWPGVSTAEVFGAANRLHGIGELDWRCRSAAVAAARGQGLGADAALFVNVEPAALSVSDLAGRERHFAAAARGLDLVLELTERDLLHDPAGLLAMVDRARTAGFRIALDDVGACPDSLALLEFVRPDIVKLDLALTQAAPAADRTRSFMAVRAYAERTGAVLLAEGIENDEHLQRARAMGAELGQGWLFGAAGRIGAPDRAARLPHRVRAAPPVARTPFEHIEGDPRVQVARKSLLVSLTRDIERQAANRMDPPVVLTAFEELDNLSGTIRDRYARMARSSPLVAVFGVGMEAEPAPGVRGVALGNTDQLAAEWTIVVLGSHYAAALIAEDVGDDAAEQDRRYRFLLTQDRDTVLAAALSLLTRFTAVASVPAARPGPVSAPRTGAGQLVGVADAV